MPVNELKRDYHMPDYDLTVFTQHVCDSMERDIVNFGVFGFTTLAVTTLQSICDTFETFPTDDFINEEYQSATEAKDILIEEVRIMNRNMALRVELKWGKNSPKYESLGISDMSQISDEAFIQRARMIWAFMDEYKAELAAEGLTQGMLDDMAAKIQDLDDAKRLQLDKLSYRAEETIARIVAGNELYDKVSRICEVGKRIWDGVNPAFFGDYVMYGAAPAPVPGKIQNLAYNTTTAKFTWQADATAISYEIQTSPDGSEWLQIYEGAAAEYINTQGPGSGLARCRGKNDNGSGAWSDELDYTVPVPVPHIVSVGFDSGNNRSVVTFDTVAFADFYLVYQSVVTIGHAAGYFDEIGQPTASPFNTVSANNAMREYYYVVASYNDVLSEHSNTVYLDVPVV